jgi:hypothetical protein
MTKYLCYLLPIRQVEAHVSRASDNEYKVRVSLKRDSLAVQDVQPLLHW